MFEIFKKEIEMLSQSIIRKAPRLFGDQLMNSKNKNLIEYYFELQYLISKFLLEQVQIKAKELKEIHYNMTKTNPNIIHKRSSKRRKQQLEIILIFY